jgi:glucose/arabinose dehydrogenase
LRPYIISLAIIVAMLPSASFAAPPGSDQLPGQQFHITPSALPAPGATPAVAEVSEKVPRNGAMPIVPDGFTAKLLFEGLPGPRRLAFGPDGRLYIAFQSSGDVLAVTEANGSFTTADHVAANLVQPFGLGFDALNTVLVGATDGLYRVGAGTGTKLSAGDAFGPSKGHITRSVAVDPKLGDIYVGVGSMNNISDSEPPMKATIQKFAAGTNAESTFATGMRNVTAMAFQPGTNDLYAVTMERDGMGDELVPDYLTRVQQGDNFGWPLQYMGSNPQPEYADKAKGLPPATIPDVLFMSHSAPLDLAFVPDSWPAAYRGDVIVALHGSWNAGQPRGYKLVLVHFKDGRPDGSYENFMTGFWVGGTAPAQVWGRAAALAFDRDGSLIVADDLGGSLWRVTPPAN